MPNRQTLEVFIGFIECSILTGNLLRCFVNIIHATVFIYEYNEGPCNIVFRS